MTDGISRGVDLFGNPIPAVRDKAGRPEHVWTQENSNKIILLFATGNSLADAAAALGISQPTFRKHYFHEAALWKVAGLQLKASMLQRLFAEANDGNVSAIKELFKQIDKGALVNLSERVIARGQPDKKAKLGKKEQQRQAAAEVGGKYAPRPAPARMLN